MRQGTRALAIFVLTTTNDAWLLVPILVISVAFTIKGKECKNTVDLGC